MRRRGRAFEAAVVVVVDDRRHLAFDAGIVVEAVDPAPFGVHAVIGGVLRLDRQEGAGAHLDAAEGPLARHHGHGVLRVHPERRPHPEGVRDPARDRDPVVPLAQARAAAAEISPDITDSRNASVIIGTSWLATRWNSRSAPAQSQS